MLFCDLVGFTAASETADPEDVAALLGRYHRLARDRIEGFGGTVEKFVGDAVMAVFGAPVAHEDDPERAVRAGLDLVSSIEEMNAAEPTAALAVRVGVNTGEAVVLLGARPEAGEAMVAGDVVNTAARIQTAAPVGAVAVGQATYAATSRVFAYDDLEPVLVKGKSAAVALWRAGAPRARLGSDVLRSMDTALVGRELEVRQLQTVFDRVARDCSVQLVTVVGEPGVGKSRLVAELFGYVDGLPDLVTWRQGRCLPYGGGITFWALGEIVKSHAGILESDSAAEATGKLDAVLPAGEDATWLRARVLPLVGVDDATSGGAVSREESFTAWRRFVESFADTGPAVVVVEDLHWADESLLAFLEHLTGWVHGLPLLVVATTRPELFDTHPGWGAGLRNATTVSLAALSETETAELIVQLLGLQLMPVETQRLILDRAEGNPLWAEECVRVLQDLDLIDATGRLRDNDVPLPQGIQALIAARLDTLTAERKELLGDAAVIGRVFWAEALIAMGDRDAGGVRNALHELTGKELIFPVRQSSLVGQVELSFWHALTRDVAYAALPRADRADKHLAAARWLESAAADRVGDVAEILAHHTGIALDLARASGDTDLATDAAPLARRHALLAADKVMGLDAGQAMQLLDRALALTPPEHLDHPTVLMRWANAANQLGHLREAATATATAAAAFRAGGDGTAAGTALAKLALLQRNLGDPQARHTLATAIALLETQPPGPPLVDALLEIASNRLTANAPQDARAFVDRALSLAAELGLPTPAEAFIIRGWTRLADGHEDGFFDLRTALELSIAEGQAHMAGAAHNMIGFSRWLYNGPEAAVADWEEGEAFALSRGQISIVNTFRGNRLQSLIECGRLDEALHQADTLLAELEVTGDVAAIEARACKARVLLETGRPSQGEAEAAVAAAVHSDIADYIAIASLPAALARLADGDTAGTVVLLSRLTDPRFADVIENASGLPGLVRCALAAGDPDLARQLISHVQPDLPVREHALVTVEALLAQAAGDHTTAVAGLADAMKRWAAFGNRLEQAYALLSLSRSLLAQHEDAEPPLRHARELFADMGAQPRVEECDTLLAHGNRHTA